VGGLAGRAGDRRKEGRPGGKLRKRVGWDLSPVAAHAHKIAQAAVDAGHPIPEDCIAPELLEECRFAYTAFNELETDRSIGMALGPVPWSVINSYADRYGITDIDEFERFVFLIRVIENEKAKHKD
jgi:hypothetical protein